MKRSFVYFTAMILMLYIKYGYSFSDVKYDPHDYTGFYPPLLNITYPPSAQPSLPVLPTAPHKPPPDYRMPLTGFIVSELSSFESAINQPYGDFSFRDYFRSRYKSMVTRYVQDGITGQFEKMASAFGTLHSSIVWDGSWGIHHYEFDYLVPLWETPDFMAFTQMGSRQFHQDHLFDLGLGFRNKDHFNGRIIYGLNLFEDYNYEKGHMRLGAGAEVTTNDIRFSTNYYRPLSGWRWQPFKAPDFRLKARPAHGFDFNVTGYLSPQRAISLTSSYFRWMGKSDLVDPAGDYHLTATASAPLGNLAGDVHGLKMTLGWQPVPLLGASISYSKTQVQVNEFSGQIDLQLRADRSLRDQLSPARVESDRMLEGVQKSIVQRNSEIILAYRGARPPDPIRLPGSISLYERSKVPINPILLFTYPPIAYKWTGTATAFFITTDTVKTPVIHVPRWNKTTPAANHYTLKVAATDWYNLTFSSQEMDVIVIDDPALIIKIVMFSTGKCNPGDRTQSIDKNNPVTVPLGAPGPQINWQVEWGGEDRTLITSSSWSDPQGILQSLTQFPQINANKNAGLYEAVLSFDSTNEGSAKQVTLYVLITQGGALTLTWDDAAAKTGRADIDFATGRQVTYTAKADYTATGVAPLKNIEYKLSGSQVADIDKTTGAVTLKQAGTARVSATQPEDANYKPSSIFFDLNVLKAGIAHIDWNSPKVIAGKVTVPFSPGGSFTTTALSNDGGIIEYSMVNPVSPIAVMDPASKNRTGKVKILAAGSGAVVTATRLEDGNFYPNTTTYNLEITKALSNGLAWPGSVVNSQYATTFAHGATFTTKAIPGNTAAAVEHSSGDKAIATIDTTTGLVALKSVGSGTVDITASQQGDGNYEDTTITYQLIIDKGIDKTLSWPAGSLKNGTYHFVYDSAPGYTLQATSQHNTGTVNYATSNQQPPGFASVNTSSGLVTVTGPGTASITATQQKDGNYKPYNITYNLDVSKGDPVITWKDPNKVDILTDQLKVPIREQDKITVAAQSKSSSNPVYRVDQASQSYVKMLDASTGEIQGVRGGSFRVIASVAEDARYTQAERFYTGKVLILKSGLKWPAPVVANAYSHQTRDNYKISATRGSNTSPLVYGVTGNASLTTGTSDGSITTGEAGTALVEVRQAADSGHAAETISYTLTVTRRNSQLAWSSGLADGATRNYPFTGPAGNLFTEAAVDSAQSARTPVYSITNQNPAGVARVTGTAGEVEVLRAGTATVSATLAQDPYFNAKTITYQLNVTRGSSDIKFDSAEVDGAGKLLRKVRKNDTFTVMAQLTTAQSVTYAVAPAGILNVTSQASGTMQATNEGDFTVTATAAASGMFNQGTASYKGRVLFITGAFEWDQSVLPAGTTTYSHDSASQYTLAALPKGNTSGAITYGIEGKTTSAVVTAINAAGVVTTGAGGTETIYAEQGGDGIYDDAKITYNLTVNRRNTTLSWPSSAGIDPATNTVTRKLAAGPVQIKAENDEVSKGASVVQYSNGGSSVADVDSTGALTLKTVGTAAIQASQPVNATFLATDISYKLHVKDDAQLSTPACEFRLTGAGSWRNCIAAAGGGAGSFDLYTGSDYRLTATRNKASSGNIHFDLTSSSPDLTMGADGSGSVSGVGTVTYTVSEDAGTDFDAYQSPTYTLSLKAAPVTQMSIVPGTCRVNIATGEIKAQIQVENIMGWIDSDQNVVKMLLSAGNPLADYDAPSLVSGTYNFDTTYTGDKNYLNGSQMKLAYSVSGTAKTNGPVPCSNIRKPANLAWTYPGIVNDKMAADIYTVPFVIKWKSDNSAGPAFETDPASSPVAGVDSVTGEVTIKDTGSVTIKATQAETSVYEAETISFIMTVGPVTTTVTADRPDSWAENDPVKVSVAIKDAANNDIPNDSNRTVTLKQNPGTTITLNYDATAKVWTEDVSGTGSTGTVTLTPEIAIKGTAHPIQPGVSTQITYHKPEITSITVESADSSGIVAPGYGLKSTITDAALPSNLTAPVTYNYQWYKDGTAIAGAVGSVSSSAGIPDYTLPLTDQSGSKYSVKITPETTYITGAEQTSAEVTMADYYCLQETDVSADRMTIYNQPNSIDSTKTIGDIYTLSRLQGNTAKGSVKVPYEFSCRFGSPSGNSVPAVDSQLQAYESSKWHASDKADKHGHVIVEIGNAGSSKQQYCINSQVGIVGYSSFNDKRKTCYLANIEISGGTNQTTIVNTPFTLPALQVNKTGTTSSDQRTPGVVTWEEEGSSGLSYDFDNRTDPKNRKTITVKQPGTIKLRATDTGIDVLNKVVNVLSYEILTLNIPSYKLEPLNNSGNECAEIIKAGSSIAANDQVTVKTCRLVEEQNFCYNPGTKQIHVLSNTKLCMHTNRTKSCSFLKACTGGLDNYEWDSANTVKMNNTNMGLRLNRTANSPDISMCHETLNTADDAQKWKKVPDCP